MKMINALGSFGVYNMKKNCEDNFFAPQIKFEFYLNYLNFVKFCKKSIYNFDILRDTGEIRVKPTP